MLSLIIVRETFGRSTLIPNFNPTNLTYFSLEVRGCNIIVFLNSMVNLAHRTFPSCFKLDFLGSVVSGG